MVALLALSIALAGTPGTPGDYFPQVPGLELTYKDSQTPEAMIRTVLPPEVKDGLTLVPVETRLSGRPRASSIYYRVDADGVYMVWLDKKQHPLKDQQPLFLWQKGNGKWSFEGATQVYGDFQPLSLKGETLPGGLKTVLGNKVETIIVKLDAVVSLGATDIRSHQDLILAKGIGIVEEQETTVYGNKKLRHTLSLVSMKLPEERKD